MPAGLQHFTDSYMGKDAQLHLLVAPASGGTLDLEYKDDAWVTLSAGTYKLPDNQKLGVTVNVYATGAVTIQTQAAATVAVLASGEVASLVATSSTTWTSQGNAASDVSLVDSGGFTTAANVEAALAEIYQSLLTAQGFVSIPLLTIREATAMDVGDVIPGGGTETGGVLAADTTPILEAINGATDGCQRLAWAASNSDPVIFQTALPPDLDDTADLVLVVRGAMGGLNDSPTMALDSYFNEGDTAVADATASWQNGETYTNYTITIAAADVPTGAATMTGELTPGTHANDALYVTSLFLRYKKKLLTS